MTNRISTAAGLAALTLLAGCATPPPLNFSPSNIGLSAVRQNASLVSTSVTIAGKQEATGKVVAGAETVVAPLWKSALEDALVRMAIFHDDAPIHLSLVVKILQFQIPGPGLTMISHATARYELIDRNSGAVVFTTDIKTDGRSPVGDDFMGANRARLAIASSVQNNIADFLKQLEGADLSRPMFPAQRQAQPTGAPK